MNSRVDGHPGSCKYSLRDWSLGAQLSLTLQQKITQPHERRPAPICPGDARTHGPRPVLLYFASRNVLLYFLLEYGRSHSYRTGSSLNCAADAKSTRRHARKRHVSVSVCPGETVSSESNVPPVVYIRIELACQAQTSYR